MFLVFNGWDCWMTKANNVIEFPKHRTKIVTEKTVINDILETRSAAIEVAAIEYMQHLAIHMANLGFELSDDCKYDIWLIEESIESLLYKCNGGLNHPLQEYAEHIFDIDEKDPDEYTIIELSELLEKGIMPPDDGPRYA